ncbi:MAG: hypothetical protein JXC32_18600 [Anaerolineae bacterium]|nr:hypothetical protein [Anaerolineae bacterium]
MDNLQVLVVYYSSSGNTRKIARAVAAALGADLEEIEPVQRVDANIRGKGLRNFGNMGRVVFGGKLKRTVDLEAADHEPADYDLVVVGTPVYANTLPPEPRTYLAENGDRFRTVAFFCSGEDPNNAHVFDLMAEASGKTPIVTRPFHAPKIIADDYAEEVEAFVAQLGEALAFLPQHDSRHDADGPHECCGGIDEAVAEKRRDATIQE